MFDEMITVAGEKCYLQSQCAEARIRNTKDAGMRALKMVTRVTYTMPGCYEMYAVTSDGELLCAKCCIEEYGQVYRETRDGETGGWGVVGLTHDGEMDTGDVHVCAHCGRVIVDLPDA